LCGNYRAQFLTAAEAGGIGKEFKSIINLIGENAVSIASGYETGEVVRVLHSSVAVAVQNGCGRIIRDNRIQVVRRNQFKEKAENVPTERNTQHKPLEQSNNDDDDSLVVDRIVTSCIGD